MVPFIAFDHCGFNNQYGRYTHIPGGETLVCLSGWGQKEWDKAQLVFFSKYPGLTIYHCPGIYRANNQPLGNTDELCAKLKLRLA